MSDNEITNVEHIKSVPIPINEEEVYKSIFVIASCDDRLHERDGKKYHNKFRAWSFWETQEKAIEEGVFGWSDAEAFYESGYYTHIVVEEIPINHPMPSGWIDNRIWFKFVPEEADKQTHDIRKAIVPCECPEYFKNIVGFF